MPNITAIEYNKEYPLPEIFDNLEVGNLVITNGDGSSVGIEYRIEVIREIEKSSTGDVIIHLGSSWRFGFNSLYGRTISIAVLDKSKAKNIDIASLKTFDVISVYSTSRPIYYIILQKQRETMLVVEFIKEGEIVRKQKREIAYNDITKIKYLLNLSNQKCWSFHQTGKKCSKAASYYIENTFICQEHAELEGFEPCQFCSRLIFSSNANSVRRQGTRYRVCSACRRQAEEESVTVHSHSYKPVPVFFSESEEEEDKTLPENKLFQGVELEVEYVPPSSKKIINDESIEEPRRKKEQILEELVDRFSVVIKDKSWFYLKTDGSLHNGIELVTHPATLTRHKQLPWDDVLSFLRDENFKGDTVNTAGIHVHVNRNFFSIDEQIKLAFFIFAQREFMEKFGRRSSNSYAQFYYYDGTLTANRLRNYISQNSNITGDRYSAINFENSHTVELRFFKSTLHYKILMSTLEFVHALAYFSKRIKIDEVKNVELSLDLFLKYLKSEHSVRQYSYLQKYLLDMEK